MTTVDAIADIQAAEGLKAVGDVAVATFVRIERAYDQALAQLADIAANRTRVLAPLVVEPAPSPVVEPVAVAEPIAEPVAVTEQVVEAATDVAGAVGAEPRVSPLVEALQALQEAEVPEEPQPVLVALTPAPPVVYPVTEVVTLPRIDTRAVETEWVAGRHAEAETDQIPVQAA